MTARRFVVGLLLIGAVLCAPAPASAGLVGHQVLGCISWVAFGTCPDPLPNPGYPTPLATVVDPGVEFLFEQTLSMTADFASDSLTLSYGYANYLYSVPSLDYSFTVQTPGFAFTGITLLSNTIWNRDAGTALDLIYSFSGDTIHVTVPGHRNFISPPREESAVFHLDFAEPKSVPDPGPALLLFGMGLAGLTVFRKWRG